MDDELEEEMKHILLDFAASCNPITEQIQLIIYVLYIDTYIRIGMAEDKMPKQHSKLLSRKHFQRRRPHNAR